jgi:hypothetical protein
MKKRNSTDMVANKIDDEKQIYLLVNNPDINNFKARLRSIDIRNEKILNKYTMSDRKLAAELNDEPLFNLA